MIYVSTTSIINNKDLFNVLERYNKLGLKNIELGSVHNYIGDYSKLFKFQKDNDINFIIHGFFPPSKNQFFINLTSQRPDILKKSIEFVKNSIEMCRKLNSPIHTIHSGFNKEIIWNEKFKYGIQLISEEIDKKLVLSTLNESVAEICDYAANYDIKIAIETMLARDKFTLMHDADIFLEFFKNNIKNLGILCDTGHMKANSIDLNFDLKDAITKLKKHIIALHLQDNNGKGLDEHLPIKNTELLDIFGKEFLKDKFITLEGQNNWNEEEILNSKKLTENYTS